MIKIVTEANILDFYFWVNSTHSEGWKYRTKIINDRLLVYLEKEN